MSFYPDLDPASSPLVRKLSERFGPAIEEASGFRGDLAVRISRDRLLEVLEFLRDDPDCAFDLLADLCGVDWLGREPRFEVVYHLTSLRHRHRLRVKTGVPGADPTLPSATRIWIGADWFEREAYDLLGILFRDHPFLRRLLTHDEFEGHALRKDYDQTQRWRCTKVSDLEGTVEVPPAAAKAPAP